MGAVDYTFNIIMNGFFDFARKEGFPTQFPSNKTAVTADVLEAGFILAFLMLMLCFYIIIPGFRGKYQAAVFIRVTLSLIIGVVLITSNFGQAWEVGEVTTHTSYKAGTKEEIHATVGVKLGLRSVNVTLLQTEEDRRISKLPGEKIDYNERFWWTWDQGRFGFGPYSGVLQQSFRQAQNRGLPLPILWVVDYFTIDGEGLRYGRHYRTAGWYAHIALWAAFPCWLLANILFILVIRCGAYFTVLTGAFELLACLLWAVIRNPNPLIIPFEDGSITTKYGIHFWLTLISGIACFTIGLVILFLDERYPDQIALFFGIDPLADYDEYHLTDKEIAALKQKEGNRDVPMELQPFHDTPATETTETITHLVLKRRSTIKAALKFRRRTPAVTVTPEDEHEMPHYENVHHTGYSQAIPEEASGSTNNLCSP
ncbi:dual oxidase maturation factor 1 isoform X2 [Cryptotermes secundus]|uniref:dual oxidase maturation factor 1 isoform X2 n=1 Tax=Cryptotermes secundus TaxID=105785 RepID=UPI000CD7DDCC|nr:dual oxidase maturation factor 1 isoform X2 [Cryptotermes secundus]